MTKILAYLNIIRFWPHLLSFLFSKNKKKIAEDLDAYKTRYGITGGMVYSFLYFLLVNKGFRSLLYFRLGAASSLFAWLAPGVSNFRISKDAEVEGGIILFHSFGSLLYCESIGSGTWIAHNVSFAIKNGRGARVGRNVKISPGAVLVGGIRIGDNCIIGPGAVVFKDIPDNCIVVGNPAYILKQDGITVKKPL
ncbi:MAG: hypothetical protein IJU69_02700 [Bacteroidales bacterium]|nr:hypothetical protein [Bacteroidales bacterium]